MRDIFFLFLIFVGLTSCSKSHEEPLNEIAISAVKLPAKSESNANAVYDKALPPEIQKKIIKEASLRFETNDLESTFNQIETAIKANKGTVQNDSEGKDDNSVYRNLTIRVPSQNFDAFISSVSKGISYFDRKDISSEDVTEEYIDLNSRLNTKRKLEARYIEILKKANKISEILEIEKQISIIREEIEAKEGRLKYLESRVSESTISIEFYKTIAQKEGVKISFGSKIWTAIKSGFFSLSEFLISIISIWPFIILFFILAYFIRKRFKRKKI
ncbi:uncharacterized protein DUF4349 [Flavobacterium chryseum]|uniref:DUF4349 domain-containing protein n=1 Tax=Flavobacterium sp. P3160 TaxID=2512113 RepID=UPI00106211F9|nr:DUF4349 domain-containing protein [Flavobacterium sp. P3160]TDO83925.1 uncharacterized protein DUF4349 [Flavobacterium sp. P3160]